MLAAVAAVTGIMDKESFVRECQASFLHKFARKPEVVSGNMKALKMAYAVVEQAQRAGHDEVNIHEMPAGRRSA